MVTIFFDDSEILDLKNPNMKCQNLAPFPIGIQGATGALVNHESAVVCGGWNGKTNVKECHRITKSDIIHLPPMEIKRSDAASIPINNTLWVLGGWNGYLQLHEKSTEFVEIPMSNASMPPSTNDWNCEEDEEQCMMMPLALMRHTILEIEANVYMLIGGRNSSNKATQNTYLKKGNQKWTRGPDLQEVRYNHASGILTDQITLKKSVVVVGGGNYTLVLKTVEFLTLPIPVKGTDAEWQWQPGN